MHTLQFRFPAEFPSLYFPPNAAEPLLNRLQLRFRQQANLVEHRRVGDRTGDVLLPEPPIEGNRFGKARDLGRWAAGEAAASGDWGLFHAWENRYSVFSIQYSVFSIQCSVFSVQSSVVSSPTPRTEY